MRLDTLDLIAYGPFTGASLEFNNPFTIEKVVRAVAKRPSVSCKRTP